MEKRSPQPLWLTIVLYVCIALGLMSLMVYLTQQLGVSVAIVMVVLFGALGSFSFVLSRRQGRRPWLILTALAWLMAMIAFSVFLAQLDLPTELIMTMFFPSVGILLYGLFRRGDADARSLNARVSWERLGDRAPQPERDAVTPR